MLQDSVNKYSTPQAIGGGWQLDMMSVKTDSFPERLGEETEWGPQERSYNPPLDNPPLSWVTMHTPVTTSPTVGVGRRNES